MSTILVDNLTGKTSAGDITVTSEGGAATQSLQQGLAKAWVNFDGTGTIAARDSLNVSGLTDHSVGEYSVNLSANMSNDDYATSVASIEGSAQGADIYISNNVLPTSSTTRLEFTAYSVSRYDSSYISLIIHGDLA